MLTFDYVAKDTATNKQLHSTVQADSERSAAKLLLGQGLVPISIVEQSQKTSALAKFKARISTKDRVVFTRQLSTLINAGVPLTQSLVTVQSQTENKQLASIAQDIITSVEGGSSLSDAFSKHPKVFDNVYLALISAGEASGTLDKALERIATQQEKDAELIGKVRGAMIYPMIVLLVIGGVIGFLLFTVVPQIQQLYIDLKAELPFVTAIMVNAADFAKTYWWAILIAIGVGIFYLRRYMATPNGKKAMDGLKINIPLFGPMFRKLYMARFTRTGETLMSTGVPMLETLRIAAQSVNNSLVEKSILRAAEKVKGGKQLSEALKSDDGYILPLVPQMISIGEQSGGIDAMMGKAATFYENELDNTIRSISTAIEPILMVVLAVVAGLMVAAILLPIYGLVGSGSLN